MASKLEAIRQLEEKLAQMEVKVQQTDLVTNQINSLFDRGLLENDPQGQVKVSDAFI